MSEGTNRVAGTMGLVAERLLAAPYAVRLGLLLEAQEPERLRLRVPYKDENSNPGRALHGGVAASAIHFAGALAAQAGVEDRAGMEAGTLDLSVVYLSAAIGEDIVAEAEVLRRGKEITYVDVLVRNDEGKRIAKGLVTYRCFDTRKNPAARERQQVHHQPVDGGAGEVPPLARALAAVPFIARLGIAVESMHGGSARMRLPFHPNVADSDGAVHEGAVAALVDTTGAMASWSLVGLDLRYKASTVGIHLNYHLPAVGADVVAMGRTLRRNNEIFLNEVTVCDVPTGRVVATGSVTYRIVVD
ncbi:MAG: hypothetical protein KatS3mg077_1894 [Candidatus Binatia bacterium]|nr:MAG: hypothetical protein KatS3mg077_1894 [Candidatus Binatia bacterium]